MSKTETKETGALESMTLELLRQEEQRVRKIWYEVGDGMLGKCPECKAKPKAKCKTSSGAEREYPHAKRKETKEVKEQVAELGPQLTKIIRLIEQRQTERAEALKLEAIKKRTAEVLSLVDKTLSQSVVIEYAYNGTILVVEADNMMMPRTYFDNGIDKETVEELIKSGVSVKVRRKESNTSSRNSWYFDPIGGRFF